MSDSALIRTGATVTIVAAIGSATPVLALL
jgi:hypothetical protein